VNAQESFVRLAEVYDMAFVTCYCTWKLFTRSCCIHNSQEKQQLQQLYRLRQQESQKHSSTQL